MGVATVHTHFSSKQNVALAAYASVLLPLVEAVESAQTKQISEETLKRFIYGLAAAAVEHPVLTIALLPAHRDIKAVAGSTSAEVKLVDFDQLASTLGRLLELHWNRERLALSPVAEVAELYLSGLLTWIVQHPNRSGEDAAKLVLSQIL